MSDDPIHDEQLQVVEGLLGRSLTAAEYQGFLIVGDRFVDRFGNTRIAELGRIFQTSRPEGQGVLAASLARVAATLGSYEAYAAAYPVTIIPPLPAFPLFPIVGIEALQDVVYRVLTTGHPAAAHIKATGRLPLRAKPVEPVLRSAPRGHWCAYEKWPTPDATRQALQILPEWGDCKVRATIRTHAIEGLAFVAYSQDPNDPETKDLHFHGYFFEGVTQDHDEVPYQLEGDAVQICVYGGPEVELLEEWNDSAGEWRPVWPALSAGR
jgi:hypothetical protein